MTSFRVPLATYRIQFNLGFRFVDGRDLVPYLDDLGITDLYSSPHFKARRGSPHAYDVANPLKINSELGTEEEFEELARKLRTYNMGLMLDIVPNHMATSPENPWWMDLLENGRNSLFVSHFAIDWDRAWAKSAGKPKVLLPLLGDLYGRVLENGEIDLKLDENGFFAKYYETRLPIDPKSCHHILESCIEGARKAGLDEVERRLHVLLRGFLDLPEAASEQRHEAKEHLKRELWQSCCGVPEFKTVVDNALIAASGIKGDPRSFDLLDRILADQHYRVAYWRTAAEELNYRRFFDITDLIGIRIEDPEVFKARHQEIVKVIGDGSVTGLRIDHIDGLWDPEGYLARLQAQIAGQGKAAGEQPGFYVIVEKVLGCDEPLPRDWQACGTTGYDYLNWLNGIFVHPAGLRKLDAAYRAFTGLEQSMGEIEYVQKKRMMEMLFPGEVRAIGYHLGRLAGQDRFARDLPFNSLVNALVEITAHLPIYRTYVRAFTIPDRDRKYLEQSIQAAERSLPGEDPEVFAFLRRVLLLDIPHYIEDRGPWLGFIMSWQQYTGPAMAKGFEDTTCYQYFRLSSQNEVGSCPDLSDQPLDVAGFHCRNRRRLEHWPYTMNATSTHDTKRSEDVRARINVLSEAPELWAERIERWAACNSSKKTEVNGAPAPDRNDEMLLYQTLVGVWPLCDEDRVALQERIRNFLQKAAREAKRHSSWLEINEPYENALAAFADAVLEESEDNGFLRDFIEFHRRIAPAGAVNALAQVLLKICSPGVPDFYQGTELWDFSLVDPDNRRPVDFARRRMWLDDLRKREAVVHAALIGELTSEWRDGRIKLYVTSKALNFRRAHPGLFLKGEYIPIDASEHVCAFARRQGDEWALAVAPRLTFGLLGESLVKPEAWGETALALPSGAPARWKNVFTGTELEGALRLADVFATFPVALLA